LDAQAPLVTCDTDSHGSVLCDPSAKLLSYITKEWAMPTRVKSPDCVNPKKNALAILGIGAAMTASFFLGRAWEGKNSTGVPPTTRGPGETAQTPGEHGVPGNASSVAVSQSSAPALGLPSQALPDRGATREIGVAPPKAAAELLKDTFDALAANKKNGNGKAFTNPLAGWHQQFAAETPDATWSVMAQSQAEAYLSDKSSQNIELVSVQCGSTVCEIQAASASAEDSEKAANEWQSNLSAMSAESWWSTYGFATPNSAIFTAPDGRALMVTYLTRLTPAGGE
jgi:hypothetical protein